MFEHRYGIKLKTATADAAILKLLRKHFPNQSLSELRGKIQARDYDVDANGELAVNIDEAAVIRWIFDRYLSGDSLGKIADVLKEQGIPSPTGKPTWNRETTSKLLSNEKYTGRVLLQKTISMGNSQIKIMAAWLGI